MNNFFPGVQVAVPGVEVQVPERERVHFFTGEDQRNFVDRGDVFGGDPADEEERRWRENYRRVQGAESSYMMQQMTKPQTIGIALSDSPLGFAAWVLEKFHRWGDTHGDIESRFSRDDLITNLLRYGYTQIAKWPYSN